MDSPASASAPQGHTLQGKRVLVTRAREQASALEQQLQSVGAIPLAFPTIRIVPPTDHYAALDAALRQLNAFDWAVFTSVNGVKHVWQRLDALGLGSADAPPQLAAGWSSHREGVNCQGLEIAITPDRYVAESL